MKRSSENLSFSHQHWVLIAFGEYLHSFSYALNPRRPNEDHLEGRSVQLRRYSHDRTVHLASICIPLDSHVEYCEALLLGVQNFLCQQDCSRASAERRFLQNKFSQLVQEAFTFEKLQKRGRL